MLLFCGVIVTSLGFITQKSIKNLENASFKAQGKSQNEKETKESIILPKDIMPERISWIIRTEGGKKNVIYAVARPLSSFLRPNPNYPQNTYEFNGVLKSEDNGLTWKKIFAAKGSDIIDFAVCNDKNLYLVIVPESGGSGEMFMQIASSRDGGRSWFISNSIAKNDSKNTIDRHPFIYGMTSNLIIDRVDCNRTYFLYKENFDSKSFDQIIYSNNFWETWERSDISM